jgi:hypothetical protein
MQVSKQSLKSRIDILEKELNTMLQMPGAHTEKKDPKAWYRLHAVDRKIRTDAFV